MKKSLNSILSLYSQNHANMKRNKSPLTKLVLFMATDQNVPGQNFVSQNASGQDVPRQKYPWTKCPRSECPRSQCHKSKCSQSKCHIITTNQIDVYNFRTRHFRDQSECSVIRLKILYSMISCRNSMYVNDSICIIGNVIDWAENTTKISIIECKIRFASEG